MNQDDLYAWADRQAVKAQVETLGPGCIDAVAKVLTKYGEAEHGLSCCYGCTTEEMTSQENDVYRGFFEEVGEILDAIKVKQ